MDALTALDSTDKLVSGLIANLTPDDRERATPCTEWTVHDLLEHMCAGGHMIACGLERQTTPAETPDYLADGPASGWAATIVHMREAATPDSLSETHKMPFGDVPGEIALSVIVADHATHAWDLARATDQRLDMDDALAEWSLAVWQSVIPAEGRTGDGFAPAVAVSGSASSVDQLVGYTGRQP